MSQDRCDGFFRASGMLYGKKTVWGGNKDFCSVRFTLMTENGNHIPMLAWGKMGTDGFALAKHVDALPAGSRIEVNGKLHYQLKNGTVRMELIAGRLETEPAFASGDCRFSQETSVLRTARRGKLWEVVGMVGRGMSFRFFSPDAALEELRRGSRVSISGKLISRARLNEAGDAVEGLERIPLAEKVMVLKHKN